MAYRTANGKPSFQGFTLIELLVVLAIISVLLTLAVPRYFQSIDKSKEVVLRENLQITRSAIDKFYADTGKYPTNLEELVEKHYLRSLPVDPIVDSTSTWDLITAEAEHGRGIYDLKSSAEGNTADGRLFSSL
ncbi:type II secretion system protein [Chitinimonas sp. BJB300]|uniref:type II secretion system protein n=1 Tax=Chitinimonas sp. BJB300 TaxID=1559339 RepID=UPI000C11A4A6|nr:prepilin-type N-terminal cleavage/methylation domain-containing protein [Chitinimonas sp. BJB300]PHV11005.1 type II secretion system protein G [Chitinimonas sp. BJB300]TSJ87008.1 prepilin-type N-terminal cleavage/methylation domain-containing protein [Chitinimonas sp. BJB300]